ncbi:MAG: DUF3825 domain-containing protein [Kiritimatiellae bacterium]|nr:DUF3825 domain-containing protein [Kiritimatiellia bacterium]
MIIYRERLDFGRDIWIDSKGLLRAIGKQLNRSLDRKEINELYRAINCEFKKAVSREATFWRQWLQNEDSEQHYVLYLKLTELSWLSHVGNVKNIQVSIRKNVNKELRGSDRQICPKYIAEIIYGHVMYSHDIRDFKVSGMAMRFRRFAFQNLFMALSTIGKIEQNGGHMDGTWNDMVMGHIWGDYVELSEEDKEDDFLLYTGMKLRPDVFDEYSSGSPISLLFRRISAAFWDILVVIADDTERPLSIEACIPSIYTKIDRLFLKNVAIERLAQLSDQEDWSYKKERYGMLSYYLESVYEHLSQEAAEEIVFVTPKADKNAMVFCTGLVTPDSDGAHYIYAYCSSPNEDGVYQSVEWLTHSGSHEKGLSINPKLVFENDRVNHGLPYPPHWVSEPERLLFDYRYGSIHENHIGFSYFHIWENLRDRLPRSVKIQFNEKFASYDECEFKKYLHAAWRRTRKILQKSFKVAIPTYYRGKIQLLVPLYLDDKDPQSASVALVVTLNERMAMGGPHYFCPTCLSLDMARMDSRVITRIDDTWLIPNQHRIRY